MISLLLYYTHNPALTTNSQGDLYLIGHGLYTNVGEPACAYDANICTLKKNSTGWDLPQTFATPPSTETFDASVSVRWSVVGWNRPDLIEFVFFSGRTSNYWDMSMYYGTLGSTEPTLTPTPTATSTGLPSPTATPTTTGVVTDCSNDTQFSTLLARAGTVTFNCGGVGAAATITVSSVKTIAANTTVDGAGKITLSGGNARRIFTVNSGATLALNNLTLTSGNAVGGGLIRNDGVLLSHH